jgi:Tfp pilus assembly protein PilW
MKGFSIVELLVGIVLSCLLVFAGYSWLTTQNRTYVVHDDIFEAQQSLRVGMERMARDLTMAGFGKPLRLGLSAWPTLNNEVAFPNIINYAISVSDGGNRLDIVGCLGPSGGSLSSAASAGNTALHLGAGQAARFNTTTNSDISIGGAENAKVVGVDSGANTLTIDTNPALAGNQGLKYGYPVNTTPIYTVMHVTYRVDTTNPSAPVLTVDRHQGAGQEVVARNISALSCQLVGNALDVTLTGRTRNRDRTTNAYTQFQSRDVIYLRNLPNISS